MRWVIEFGGDPQDVTVTTTGEATTQGFFRPGMLVLLDHTDLVVDELTSQDVRRIATDFATHQAALRSTFVALVAPEPVQFGLARMSTSLVEPAAPTIRVFSTRTEALGWLRQVRDDASGATT